MTNSSLMFQCRGHCSAPTAARVRLQTALMRSRAATMRPAARESDHLLVPICSTRQDRLAIGQRVPAAHTSTSCLRPCWQRYSRRSYRTQHSQTMPAHPTRWPSMAQCSGRRWRRRQRSGPSSAPASASCALVCSPAASHCAIRTTQHGRPTTMTRMRWHCSAPSASTGCTRYALRASSSTSRTVHQAWPASLAALRSSAARRRQRRCGSASAHRRAASPGRCPAGPRTRSTLRRPATHPLIPMTLVRQRRAVLRALSTRRSLIVSALLVQVGTMHCAPFSIERRLRHVLCRMLVKTRRAGSQAHQRSGPRLQGWSQSPP